MAVNEYFVEIIDGPPALILGITLCSLVGLVAVAAIIAIITKDAGRRETCLKIIDAIMRRKSTLPPSS